MTTESGSPANPLRSDEGVGKSGVSLTIEEHLDRIETALRWNACLPGAHLSRDVRELCERCMGKESLTALREWMEDL